MREILESFSLFPSKDNRRTAFYFAIDREEKTPSLSVNFEKNMAFDFGTGMKYDNISLVQGIKKCSVSDALEHLKNFDCSFQIKEKIDGEESQPEYQILKVTEVEHPSLIDYLRSRKIDCQRSLLKEIHYQIRTKKYFSLAFLNDSDGFEIRNKYSKICLGKKDITTIKNSSETVRIFEGFTDYLSYKILEKSFDENLSDYIILNSVSLVFRMKKVLGDYAKVELYLDNDKAGDDATQKIKTFHSNVEDCRLLYKNYNDLNDFINRKGPSYNP